MKSVSLLVLTLLGLLVVSIAKTSLADEAPFIETRTLSAGLANTAVLAAFNDCSKRGFHVAVALSARDGNLQAFMRSPLAGPHTVEVSQRKAYTAATYQASTLSMMQREELKFSPGVLLLGGGLPIRIGGHFYGSIAVSGAPAEKISGDVDEQCAQSGINAIRDVIEFHE
ncbi:GlcG/HbpS family heme-binding protein [Kaarinaea lacus]